MKNFLKGTRLFMFLNICIIMILTSVAIILYIQNFNLIALAVILALLIDIYVSLAFLGNSEKSFKIDRPNLK